MKKIVYFCLAFACVSLVAFPLSAKTNEELARENAELKERVENLESQLTEVLQILKSREAPAEKQPAEPAKEPSTAPSVSSRFPMNLYGFIRLDGSYDDSRTNNGEVAFYALSGADNDGNDEFNFTARGTRLGLRIDGPEYEDIDISGLVEADFSGGGDDISNHPRLRHAWFDLTFPDQWRLLAGQTWDVPGPLITNTLNQVIAWRAGNVGFRKPQVRLEKWFTMDDSRLLLQAAAASPYGLDHDKDTIRDGEDAGIPDLQGRVAYKFPLFDKRSAEFGLGGHYGRREVDAPGRSDREYDSWSVVFDANMQLLDWLTLQGELWTGQFMEGFQGGAGQGFDLAASEPIDGWGGFAQLLISPHRDWKIFTGLGVDNPEVESMGLIDKNLTYFVNARYNLTSQTWVGLEYQRFETDYKDMDDADDNRFQTTFFFLF
jgi:hypothetical protein